MNTIILYSFHCCFVYLFYFKCYENVIPSLKHSHVAVWCLLPCCCCCCCCCL